MPDIQSESQASTAGQLKLPPELAEALVELLMRALVDELAQSDTAEILAKPDPARQAPPQQVKLAALRDKLLPLAHARRKPGRPRKVQSGHNSGTEPPGTLDRTGSNGGALAMIAVAPRLLDLPQTAHYLGVSVWTVRDLESAGILHRICIPLPGGRDLRRLLFDKAELDQLIQTWKDDIVPVA